MIPEMLREYVVNFKFYDVTNNEITIAREFREKRKYLIINDCRNFCLKHKYSKFHILKPILERWIAL